MKERWGGEMLLEALLLHYSMIRPIRKLTAPPGHVLLAAVLLIRLSIVFLFVTKCIKTSERKMP